MAKAKRHNFFLFIRKWRTGAFSESSARLESSMNDQSMFCAFVLIVSACTVNTFRLIDFVIRHFRHMTSMFLQDRCVFAKSTKIKKKSRQCNVRQWIPFDFPLTRAYYFIDSLWIQVGRRLVTDIFWSCLETTCSTKSLKMVHHG